MDDLKIVVNIRYRRLGSHAPHLGEKEKETLMANIPPYQRDARSKGIPQLGSGAIYPVPESEITVPDMEIPVHWARGYGLDVGWNRTAAIFGALNRDDDVIYLYSEHYRGQAEPSVHANQYSPREMDTQAALIQQHADVGSVMASN